MQQVFDTAGERKSLMWVETTNQVQIRDIEPYVGQATGTLADWLGKPTTPDGELTCAY